MFNEPGYEATPPGPAGVITRGADREATTAALSHSRRENGKIRHKILSRDIIYIYIHIYRYICIYIYIHQKCYMLTHNVV